MGADPVTTVTFLDDLIHYDDENDPGAQRRNLRERAREAFQDPMPPQAFCAECSDDITGLDAFEAYSVEMDEVCWLCTECYEEERAEQEGDL